MKFKVQEKLGLLPLSSDDPSKPTGDISSCALPHHRSAETGKRSGLAEINRRFMVICELLSLLPIQPSEPESRTAAACGLARFLDQPSTNIYSTDRRQTWKNQMSTGLMDAHVSSTGRAPVQLLYLHGFQGKELKKKKRAAM